MFYLFNFIVFAYYLFINFCIFVEMMTDICIKKFREILMFLND